MEEIGEFCEDDNSAEDVFEAFAEFYERIADDQDGPKREIAALDRFCVE